MPGFDALDATFQISFFNAGYAGFGVAGARISRGDLGPNGAIGEISVSNGLFAASYDMIFVGGDGGNDDGNDDDDGDGLQKNDGIICRILSALPGDNLFVDTSARGGLGFLFDSSNCIMIEDGGRISITNELSACVGLGLRGRFLSLGIEDDVQADNLTYSTGLLAELDTGISWGTLLKTGSLEKAFCDRIGAILGYGEIRSETRTLLDLGC